MLCLLIDDDIPTIEALVDIVNWSDYGITEVAAAYNLQDGQRLFENREPDLIICDIEMPRGSGIDMIKWVRERRYEGGFIFFTCHESFEFASTAITYSADFYLVKPLDKQKLEAALMKTIETLRQKRTLDEYSKLGLTWLKNKDLVEKSFWRDVLTAVISPRTDLIQGEIMKRELSLSVDCDYVLFLSCIPRSQIEGKWADSLFQYAFSNLCSEIIFHHVNHDRVIAYQSDNVFFNAAIIEGVSDIRELKERGEQLIRMCRQHLKCTATCYISDKTAVSLLSQAREQLEILDASNIIFQGIVHYQKDPFNYTITERYTLDFDLFMMLFIQKEKVQIVNRLKKELETLSVQNRLDSTTLHAIREDFLQVVYSFLSRNHIQAHRLFAGDATQLLAQHAERSVFDFMKWAQLITDKSIESVKEALQSEGVVERAKRFIHENYKQELTREDVAASVYLTPDYMAKVFKSETELSIKEYVNEYRIKTAKQLLIESTLPIGQIAMETGFDSISYFSTVFKKLTGETPNAFRAKHKSSY